MAAPASPSARAWLNVALIAFGLLLIPMIAWVALPRVSIPSAAPSASGRTLVPGEVASTADAPGRTGARTLKGHVIDSAGNGVVGGTVTLEVDGKTVRDAPTRAGGTFTLSAPPEAVTLIARAKGYAAARLDVAAGPPESDLEIRVHTAAPVSGVVVDGAGHPVAGAFVECDGSGDMTATSGEDGRFQLPADADGCRATATHADHGTSPPVALSAGDKNTIELPSPGAISGVVVDDVGKPITKFAIGVESYVPALGAAPSGGPRSRRVEDASGEFKIEGLGAGKYVLVASAEGRPPAKSDPVELEPGRTETGVRIVLGKGGALRGTVTDRETGKPVVGVRVRLDAISSPGAMAITPATTDDGGHYRLEGTPRGPFSVRFSHKDYGDRIVSLDGTNDADLTKDVDLAAGGDATEMTGIGATLGMGTKFVEVASVLPGGPAEAAGMKAGDTIERIDGASAEGFTVSDAVQRLRGPEGTRVNVTLGRGGAKVELTITRAKIVR